MKKLINRPYLSLVLLLSALFFPAEAWADMYFWDNGIPVTEKSVNWSERNSQNVSWPIARLSQMQVPAIYSSTDANIATVDASGNVTIVSPGVVSINASYTTSGDVGQTYNASYTLTIVDDRDDMEISGVAFFPLTASATYGDKTVNTPTINSGKLGNATFTYSSSNEGVAMVDNAGTVTIKGAGTAEIKASFAGNDNFKPGYLTYTLTVAQKEVGLTWGTTEFTYNDNFQAPTADATGLEGSDVCSVTVEGAQKDPGSNYTATATGLSNDNYKLPAANTTTFSISKAASSVTTAPSANSLTYTGSAQALVTAGTASGGTMQYSLDKQTYSEAIPTGTDAGSYTVYYRVVGDANHEDADGGNVSVTINKAASSVAFASKTANAKIGEGYASQTATTSPAGLPLTYSSSNTGVATVDASSGAVTLVAPGSTTITASFAGNDNYNAAQDSYELSVAKADAVDVELSFGSATATATYGDATVNTPALNNPHQLPLVWTSSNENVAKVNASGNITIVGAGQTTIYASFAGNDEYRTKTIYYTLTVNKYPVSVAFATSSETATLGENYVSPKAIVNPSGMTLEYSSSDPNVASVDANTGDVTLVGAGTAMIRAKFFGSDNYETASAYYTLTVKDATPRLEPIVKEEDYPLDVDAYFINADGSEVDLSNTIVNNILFTLKNQGSPEGDGYDTEDHCIVINTVTPTSTVNALLANNVEPGSADYVSQFTGLSFLVPAGEGYIIVTSQEADGVYLMVKVGENDPVAIHLSEMGDYSIPYKSDFLTMVRMWKGDSDAQNYASTRGKKKMADVRVTKVTYKAVSSNGIQRVSVDAFDDNHWYDLNGQRISQPVKKGVYIHGNRKVVIK